MQCELKRFLEYVPLNEWTYDFQRTVGTYLCPKKRLFEKKNLSQSHERTFVNVCIPKRSTDCQS